MTTPAVPDQGAPPLAALTLRGVTQRFGGVVAVRDVDIDVPHGARRALLGPNGAGKTTLFNIIAGDYRPTAGTITLFGADVTAADGRLRVGRGLARTYQRSHLFFGLSVQDNLTLAHAGRHGHRYHAWSARSRRAEVAAAVTQVAVQVGLADHLTTVVGSMSHGQQRQLEIGMALAANPRLMILHEPAAGLSPRERGLLTALLADLPREMTLLLIEHDMDVALTIADSVTLMRDGAVIVEGTPDEIRTSAVVREVYLGAGHG
ncbi:MAG: ABC transporter ATP-binding protein [Tetrasphaera jenkinsii]|nr:ABC transporter ATP-binding protein [Tetrasphaera jenkinsii]